MYLVRVSGWRRQPARRMALPPPAMNRLLVGKHKDFHDPPIPFLLIDDGEVIDALHLPPRRKATVLDFNKHSFNPLKDMDYRKAREFIAVLDAVFPEGENTLTKKTSNFVLLNALLSNPKRLHKLVRPSKTDTGQQDAYQKIATLMMSPVLERVLCRPTNFSFDGILLARLNRAELGDFDCFVLGNLLISQYQGQIIIPDFGFYACKHHTALIRQNRLIAGLNFLDEVLEDIRNNLLLIDDKVGHRCTAKDAETLAGYSGYAAHSDGWATAVELAVK